MVLLVLLAVFATIGVQTAYGDAQNVSDVLDSSVMEPAEQISEEDYASYLEFPEEEEPDIEDEYYHDQNRSLTGVNEGAHEDYERDYYDEEDPFYMNDTDYNHHLRRQLDGCDDCVVNYNRRVMKGRHQMIGVPVAFSNCKFGRGRPVPYGALRRAMRYVSSFYNKKSRGEVNLIGTSISSVKQMSQRARCSAKFSVKRKFSFSSYAVKIATYACKICSYSNAGGGWVHFGKGSFGSGTLVHETGHLFGLAHATSIMYDKKKRPIGVDDYGDFTSQMGRRWSASYNAPMHHWLGWLRSYEVKYARPGRTYKLRALDNVSIDQKDVQAALVYVVPHSGLRMYIALRRRSSGIVKKRYFENNLVGFAIHLASPCHNCRHFKTLLLKIVKPGRYEDENGLVLETKILNSEADMATVKVSYDASKARCTARPQFELKGGWNFRVGSTITVTMKNMNAPSCRPLYVNPELITGIYGSETSYWEKSRKFGWKYNNNKLILGGDKQIRVYKLRRKDGIGQFVFDFAGYRKKYCVYKGALNVVAC